MPALDNCWSCRDKPGSTTATKVHTCIRTPLLASCAFRGGGLLPPHPFATLRSGCALIEGGHEHAPDEPGYE